MKTNSPHFAFSDSGRRFVLRDPYLAPTADAFLWNPQMMLQITCRGFAWGQTMQPDAAIYAYPPSLLAKTFMQPEPRYFAHHPGRFFYVRDDATGEFFSAPHDPVRAAPRPSSSRRACRTWPGRSATTVWRSRCGSSCRRTTRSNSGPRRVANVSDRARKVSLYPYFPAGYLSWMHMAGEYDAALQAAVCPYVTPYQKLQDYEKNKTLKETTFLASDVAPDSWGAEPAAVRGRGRAEPARRLEAAPPGPRRRPFRAASLHFSVSPPPAAGQAFRSPADLRSRQRPAGDRPAAEEGFCQRRVQKAFHKVEAAPRSTPAASRLKPRTRGSTTSSTTGCRGKSSTLARPTA